MARIVIEAGGQCLALTHGAADTFSFFDIGKFEPLDDTNIVFQCRDQLVAVLPLHIRARLRDKKRAQTKGALDRDFFNHVTRRRVGRFIKDKIGTPATASHLGACKGVEVQALIGAKPRRIALVLDQENNIVFF